MLPDYLNTADELTKRIFTLIPEHPEILEMQSPWDLFKVTGFQCNDLNPSLFQAGFALCEAQRLHKGGAGAHV